MFEILFLNREVRITFHHGEDTGEGRMVSER
jgi:hypothetical protein